VSELTLDYDQRDAFVCHLDRVCVPQLVRREPPPDARRRGRMTQLLARGRGFPAPAGCRAVDHAQQRSDRELAADLEPWVELLPGPTIHPDLAPLAAFPSPDKHSAASAVEIALLKGERFANPQTRAPQHNNQRADPAAVWAIADGPHDSDDLLDGRRIGRILLALIAWRPASVITGHRRR
jgi:hypothetical protein